MSGGAAMSWITTKLLAYVSGALLLICIGLFVALRLSRAEVATMEADHLRAVTAAQAEQRKAEIARDTLLSAIADATAERAKEASKATQAQASQSKERIRTVYREAPANCPAELDSSVHKELNVAIDHANQANE
jgi:ABC-type protease/lipase transport system fused ATPase/permease subunit